MSKNTGTVAQIMGPVLDIRFPDGKLPQLLSAIEVPMADRVIVAEVAQHIGDNVARCIAMSSTDGLARGAEAIDIFAKSTLPVAVRKISSVRISPSFFNIRCCVSMRSMIYFFPPWITDSTMVCPVLTLSHFITGWQRAMKESLYFPNRVR